MRGVLYSECPLSHVPLSIHVGMCVLEGTHADRDSGIVNTGEAEGEGLTTNHKVLVLLLEQEILFIELAFPE